MSLALLLTRSDSIKPDGSFLSGVWFICCRRVVRQNLFRSSWVIQGDLLLFAFDPHPCCDGIPQSTLGLGACEIKASKHYCNFVWFHE